MSGDTGPAASATASAAAKRRLFWSVAALFVVADVVTKYWAHTQLAPRMPVQVFGDVVRLTLGYNPGAAFGLHLGTWSRWIFLALALVILVVLGSMYRQAAPGDRVRVLALALVCGGAMGNVINRLWSPRGVVDFLDVGIGSSRWPTFNVADIGVTLGALLLAWVLWREDSAAGAKRTDATESGRGRP